MALYTKDSIDRLKEAVDMVELVSAKTDLRRVGTRFTGLCPFHDERTPSFSVNAQERLYHCFGCGASGDAIKFVQETEALEFRDAVDALAERYRVELKLEDEDPQAEERRRRRERSYALLDRAAGFYEKYLWESGEAAAAREYLASRDLSDETLRTFRVGYSPSAWDRLSAGARGDGFTDAELLAAGLAQRGRGIYDRFRARIMFPLSDSRGRVLGFGARAMGDGQGPKYLNTSENDLYHKGRQLFGVDIARVHSSKIGRVVVVEGYTDVLALHQAGVRETVAIMGTALTEEQLVELGKLAGRVYLALDADRSGQEAMLRAARAARERDLELRVVVLAEGRDPADIVAADGAAAIEGLLKRAVSVLEFEVGRVLADADLNTPEGRDRAFEAVTPLIGEARGASVREQLVRYVSDRLDVPVATVTAQLRGNTGQGASGPVGQPRRPPEGGRIGAAGLAAERAFLAMCLASGAQGREYLEKLEPAQLSTDAIRAARAHLLRAFDDPMAGLTEEDPSAASLVTAVASAAADTEAASEPILRMSLLQLELRRIDRELRRADQTGDRPRQKQLAGAQQDVRRDLDTAMAEIV